jgi:hypothetical protein
MTYASSSALQSSMSEMVRQKNYLGFRFSDPICNPGKNSVYTWCKRKYYCSHTHVHCSHVCLPRSSLQCWLWHAFNKAFTLPIYRNGGKGKFENFARVYLARQVFLRALFTIIFSGLWLLDSEINDPNNFIWNLQRVWSNVSAQSWYNIYQMSASFVLS